MSLSIADVIATLRTLKLPSDILVKAETQLETLEADKREEKGDAAPKAKSQHVVILLDPEHKLTDLGEFVALVTQVPEEDDAGQTLDKLYQSVYDQRAAAKRKVRPIVTVGDAADGTKRKYLKERRIAIKTKTPVRVLVSDNTIPV